MGGAMRFLQELDGYLSHRPDAAVVVGRSRELGVRWLMEREVHAGRCQHSVALNNVTFLRAGEFKTVLIRNALHFLEAHEPEQSSLNRRVQVQARMVRAMAARADRIVVPTSTMAQRVATACPRAASRILVMAHPVTSKPRNGKRDDVVLCPVLDAPYKRLGPRLKQVISAMQSLRDDAVLDGTRLLLTLSAGEATSLGLTLPAWVQVLGRLPASELRAVQGSARAIVYPTTLESFGYPLAEARLARQPVISPHTEHAVEVAGDALVPYNPDDPSSLAAAIERALNLELEPLTENPFDPKVYFDRLFSVS